MATIYASPNGKGSGSSQFDTTSLDMPGDTVQLSAGDFQAPLAVGPGVTLKGMGPATRIIAPE